MDTAPVVTEIWKLLHPKAKAEVVALLSLEENVGEPWRLSIASNVEGMLFLERYTDLGTALLEAKLTRAEFEQKGWTGAGHNPEAAIHRRFHQSSSAPTDELTRSARRSANRDPNQNRSPDA